MQHGSDGGDDRMQQHGQPAALLQKLTAQVKSAILATDLEGTITCFNKGAELLLGYRAGDLVGKETAALFLAAGVTSDSRREFAAGPDSQASGFAILSALAAEFGSWTGERSLISKDGVQLPVRLSVTVMLDGSGTPSGYLCIAKQLPVREALKQELDAQRELFNATLESLPHPFYLKDPDGVFINCNSRFADFLGVDRETVIGSRTGEIPPRPSCIDGPAQAEGDEAPAGQGCQQTVRRAGQDSAVLFFQKVDILGDAGVTLGVAGSILDITGQTRIEEELQRQATMLEEKVAMHQRVEEVLREREKMLSLVINAVPQNIFWKDTNLVFVGCNERFARSAGLSSPAEIVGKTDFDLPWRPEETEGFQRDDREVMRLDCARYSIQESQLQKDGSVLTLDTTKIPLHDDGGSVVGVLGVYEDISKRMSVERDLKESEERLRVIFEASQAGIILVGPDGIVSFANRRMAEMFGVEIDGLLGTSYSSWLHPSDKRDGDTLAAQLANGEIGAVNVERHYLRGDGGDFWGYLSGRRLKNEDGTLRALIGCIADVTELKNSQHALKQEKERLTVTLRSIGDGVITVDTDGRVVLLNRAAEGLCGYRQEEAAGLPLDQVFRVIDERTGIPKQNSIARALASGVVVEESGIGMLVSRDGGERIIVSKTAPILDRDQQIPGVVLVFSDITERRGIEEELFKARKLESLGILAGGIAHDFNNLLTGIMGNISLSRAQLPDGDQAATFLDRARKGSEQAKELTLQLLTFSKGGAPIKKLTSITQVLTDSAIFALRGSNVRCDFDIDPYLWSAEIDTGQMSQVISNLVINADQAMPEGGAILIRAENVLPLDESDHGRRIRITFKDTGIGISEEDVSRIYDPYFSTKATGSGLGLATVYAIIKNHDGEIRVFSRLNHGTTFAITLPAQEGSAPEQAISEPTAELETGTGGGKVLLMDDEDAIREMAAAALSMFGYQSEVACDGEEMLQIYRQAQESGAPFDAVIMDLTVPGGMGGKEAVRKLLEMDPRALAIASSGYSEDPVMANYQEYGFAGIVSKPYSLQELDDTLKEILANGLN
jgi:PAS domain S-box-containing protein